MPNPWTTPAEPGMRARRFCPLCGWFLDSPEPDPFPTVDAGWLRDARVKHGKFADDRVFLAMLHHCEQVESVLRAHIETHQLEEWVAAAAKLFVLRRSIDLLADVAPPSPDRLERLVNMGELAVNDVRWIRFAQDAIGALATKLESKEATNAEA